jgi:hypothetical protein
MTATRRMWAGFILFIITFVVFDSGITAGHSWPRWLVWGSGIAALLAFLYAMYVFYFDVTRGDRHLQRNGIKGTAVVLEAKRTNTLAQTGQFDFNAPYIWKYTLEITIPGRAPYRAQCTVAREGVPAGSTVRVAVSKMNRRSVAMLPDPVTPAHGHHGQMWQVPSPAGTGERHIPAPGGELDRIQALKQLVDLHRQGALTDAEFAAEKSRILSA